MACYFIYTVFSVRNTETVNYYEVEEGSLVKEQLFRGMIVREESIVYSEESGTVYYFVADGRKAASGSKIYAIDSAGTVASYLEKLDNDTYDEDMTKKLSSLNSSLMEYQKSFDEKNFSVSYDIDTSLKRSVSELSALSLFSRSASEMESLGISFDTFYTDRTGTISFYADGYEDVDLTHLSESLLSESGYEKKTFFPGELVEKGDPVYKIVTDEKFYIVFLLTDEARAVTEDGAQYRISFPDKGFNCVADINYLRAEDGSMFGVIHMSSYLVQFTDDRFVNFELVTNNVSGLKIPDRSLVTKYFYCIPEEYLSYDDAGNSGFFLVSVGENGHNYDFVITDIYSIEDGYCYIDSDEEGSLSSGDYVSMNETGEGALYEIRDTRPLLGVYNINKGYTVFRRVEVLESSNGYSIVRKNTDYGLSPYDHIVLDASTVEEGEILYR